MNREHDDFWFKLLCFYRAKTELYDRTLTDKRSPHDATEAWIADSADRALSNKYAMNLYDYCKRIALKECGSIVENGLFREYFFMTEKHCHFSAQRWIDTYYKLLKDGEMDFFERYFTSTKDTPALAGNFPNLKNIFK